MENYTHLRNLDRGATGQVALYLQLKPPVPEREQKVVIKRVDLRDATSAQDEVKILRSLDHPNIVRHRTSFLDHGRLCIVMEYASGGSLSRLLWKLQDQGEFMSEEKVTDFTCQLLLALDYLHSRGVLHRDLKPDNILLTTTARDFCKLADFGVSELLRSELAVSATTRRSGSRKLAGTPAYLSPELLRDFGGDQFEQTSGQLHRRDPQHAEPDLAGRADVWALGCVVYEMCCLRMAFNAEGLPAVVAQIAKADWEPLDGERYSPLLSELISQMLTVDPERRPSARQLLAHPLVLSRLFPLFTDLGCVGLRRRAAGGQAYIGSATTVKRIRCNVEGNQSLHLYSAGAGGQYLTEVPYSLPHEDLRCVRLFATAPALRLVGLTKRGRLVRLDQQTQQQLGGLDWSLEDVPGLEKFRVVKLATGDSFAACLTDTGVVLTLGCGATGALGHGDFADCERPRAVAALAEFEMASLACGPVFAACATRTGDLLAWGRHPLMVAAAAPPPTLPTPLSLSRARALRVFAGPDALLVWTSERSLLGAGSNRFGRLGPPEAERPRLVELEPLPLPDGGLAKLLTASVSCSHSLLVTGDGELLAAGQVPGAGCAGGFRPMLAEGATVSWACAGDAWALAAVRSGDGADEKLVVFRQQQQPPLNDIQQQPQLSLVEPIPLIASCRVHDLSSDASGSFATLLRRRSDQSVESGGQAAAQET